MTADCSPLSWSESYSDESVVGCMFENYTGSVCSKQLISWQECALGHADAIYLHVTSENYTQEEMERNVAQFLYFLRELWVH